MTLFKGTGTTPTLEPTQINYYGIIALAVIYCRIILRYGQGQLKESRPTKNDGETVSAAGVTRPQNPGTCWTSTLRWRALRKLCFCLRTS